MKEVSRIPVTPPPVVSNGQRPDKAGTVADNSPDKTQKSAPAPATANSTPTKVTMTEVAHQMVQSRQVSAADVDQKKVDAVRSAIEKKTFKVNAEAIADKMLSTAEEMLQKRTH